MEDIKESEKLYKKLRNKIRQYPLEDILCFSWTFNNYLLFGKKLAPEIPGYKYYNQKDGRYFETWAEENLYPWYVDIIFREYLVHFDTDIVGNRRFLSGRRIPDTIGLIGLLLGKIIEEYKKEKAIDIQAYMWRLQYQQLSWQGRDLMQDYLRYYILYSDQELKKCIKEEIDPNFDIEKILLIGGLFFATYLDHFWIQWPISQSKIKSIKEEDIEFFINSFVTDLSSLINDKQLKKSVGEDFEFRFNPLKRHPLVVIDDKLYCPEPSHLVDMMTKGLRYIILEKKQRGKINSRFGIVFEEYCFNIAKTLLASIADVYSDDTTKTKDGNPRTVDTIIDDQEATLFVECKGSYICKKPEEDSYEKALDQISIFLEEAYNSLSYYKQGKYPQVKYSSNKNKVLLLTLIDDIYMIPSLDKTEFETDMLNRIKLKAQEKGRSLDESLIKEIPWKVCRVSEYEYLVGKIKNCTLSDTLQNQIKDESWPILSVRESHKIDLGEIFGVDNNVYRELANKIILEDHEKP